MKLTLGTVQFGLNYGVQGNEKPDYFHVMEIFDTALECGITSFDTAQAYGDAEEILGKYLINSSNRQKIEVITKLNPSIFKYPRENWKKEAISNTERSLELLHTDCIEGLLLHNAEHIFDPQAVEVLLEIKKRGYCKNIGVSIYKPEEALKTLEYPEISVVQIPYNILDDRLDKCGFFKKASKRGIRIYSRSIMLQGLLTISLDNYPEKMNFAKDKIVEFDNICKELGMSRLEAAISYVCNNNSIYSVVFGTDNLRQITEFVSIVKANKNINYNSVFSQLRTNITEQVVSPTLW